jgi:uncharacterized protein (DUF885 family)
MNAHWPTGLACLLAAASVAAAQPTAPAPSHVGSARSESELFDQVREDPRSYYDDSAAGRAQYLADANALLEEVRSRQGEVFGRLPKADVVVRAVEPWRITAPAGAIADRGSRRSHTE